MADLARLKRMAPFRDMSGAEFRSMVDELRTLVPRAASGATGQMSTVRGTAVRTRFQSVPAAEVPPVYLAQVCSKGVEFGTWASEWAMCKVLQNQPADPNAPPVVGGSVIVALMFPPGQLYQPGSWITIFKATFPGEENASDRTAWIGTAIIRAWNWEGGAYWAPPDCEVEQCGADVPPDPPPTWPDGSCF